MKAVKTVLWKEIKDLSRDYRTIVAVVVLPLIGLPGLALVTGILVTSQSVTIALVVEDPYMEKLEDTLIKTIDSAVRLYGIEASIKTYEKLAEQINADLLIYIPNGFYNNISSINGQGTIIISVLIGSQASELAQQAIESTFMSLANSIVENRIKKLGEAANIKVEPKAVLNPIKIERGFHKVTGAPATQKEASVADAAKILEFSLFFVVNPTVVFMSDSIVGEKERKTIEKLLLAPLTRRQLLAGKLLAAGILGLLSAVADGIGIILFFWISGLSFTLSPSIILIWIIAVILLVLTTAPLISIIAARSETIRAAQNASFIVVMIALAIYFSALSVDIAKLPQPLSILLNILPFTQAALMIHYYALGELFKVVVNIISLVVLWLALTVLAARSFDTEKLVMYKI
ncbi:MAG: ABC transporter permease [Desulfurococcales archaeon]|nr:ABC transporter permease [Desulfurococcales archaeon]